MAADALQGSKARQSVTCRQTRPGLDILNLTHSAHRYQPVHIHTCTASPTPWMLCVLPQLAGQPGGATGTRATAPYGHSCSSACALLRRLPSSPMVSSRARLWRPATVSSRARPWRPAAAPPAPRAANSGSRRWLAPARRAAWAGSLAGRSHTRRCRPTTYWHCGCQANSVLPMTLPSQGRALALLHPLLHSCLA